MRYKHIHPKCAKAFFPRNGHPTLSELLCALICEPEEAEDVVEQYEKGYPLPDHSLAAFASRGSAMAATGLSTIREWAMAQNFYIGWIVQTFRWNHRLMTWSMLHATERMSWLDYGGPLPEPSSMTSGEGQIVFLGRKLADQTRKLIARTDLPQDASVEQDADAREALDTSKEIFLRLFTSDTARIFGRANHDIYRLFMSVHCGGETRDQLRQTVERIFQLLRETASGDSRIAQDLGVRLQRTGSAEKDFRSAFTRLITDGMFTYPVSIA